MYLLHSSFDHFNCQKLISIIFRRGHYVVYLMWRPIAPQMNLRQSKKVQELQYAFCNQIFLILNFRFGKEHYLLILEFFKIISAQKDS